jgi:hypothetical protein
MNGARFAWLFGLLLFLAGLLPALLFSLGTLLPSADASALLGVFPEVPGLDVTESWLYARKIKWAPSAGLVFALAGIGAMILGAALVRSQRPVLDAVKARKRDALRRRQQYGSPERIEPTLE